jgi:hypothetical protein
MVRVLTRIKECIFEVRRWDLSEALSLPLRKVGTDLCLLQCRLSRNRRTDDPDSTAQ